MNLQPTATGLGLGQSFGGGLTLAIGQANVVSIVSQLNVSLFIHYLMKCASFTENDW